MWKSEPIASHGRFFVLRIDAKPRQTLTSFFGRQRTAIEVSVQEVDRCVVISFARN
jgi:hypothetical protein